MARAHNVSTVTVTDCHIKGLKMEKKVKTGVTLMVAALLTLLGVWAQTKSLKRSPSNSFTQMEKLYTGQYSGPALAPDCDHQQTPRPRLAVYYVHSGSALREQCDLQRQVCFPHYKKHNVSHHFVVGLPSFDNRQVDQHAQGQLPTEKEAEVGKMLLDEQVQYGDILVTPHRDYYRDLHEKLMGVIRFGVEAGAEYIVKPDDDKCINVARFHAMVRQHEKKNEGKELYGGIYGFKGDEYESMKGPHGEIAPFVSGHVIVLSRGLARILVGPEWMYNILKVNYGTSSDDANLGKMIARAEKIHNVSVSIVYDMGMLLCDVLKERNSTENMITCQTREAFD